MSRPSIAWDAIISSQRPYWPHQRHPRHRGFNFHQLLRWFKVAEAIRYGLNHWDGLLRFLADGRIEIDSNTVEREIRGHALTRKNSLFAGHDLGAAGWAMHASFMQTCKLNSVDPQAWLTDVLTKLVNLWPASRIGELMPWAYAPKPADPEATGDGPTATRAPSVGPHLRVSPSPLDHCRDRSP